MGIQLRATVGLAALALLLPASAATAVAEPTASSGHSAIAKRVSDFTWEGTWDSNWGTLTLVGDVNHVDGSYTHDNGRFALDLVPGASPTYRGSWNEEPTRTGPHDAGPMQVVIAEDGLSLTGNWSYEGNPEWDGTWTATCVAGACLGNTTSPTGAVEPVTGAIKGPRVLRRPAKKAYRFTSPTAGVSYQYRIDKRKWRTARGAKIRIASKRLRLGRHVLRVRAVLDGAVDPTPSRKRFKVLAAR